MSVMSFSIPRTIYYGEGALEKLSLLKGKKAASVTGGSSMKRYGFLDQAEALLKKAGIESILIDGVEPNTSVETVMRGAKEMLAFEPDWIVAIGGGSALDAAKVMWCFYEHPEISFESIIEPGAMSPLRTKAQFIAIPSTSGTASEITAFSVITDTQSHIKYPIVAADMVPDIAILDHNIPMTMPRHITANTGMDVMAHALEAVASIAATSFTNASLGLVHSMAHKIGGEFGVTHGLSNAILLPYVIAYNRKSSEKYAYAEKMLGIKNISEEIQRLNREMDIPLTLKECTEVDFSEEKFLSVLDRMSQHAFEDSCTLTNPGTPTVADIRMIFEAAYYGKEIE
ncbi:MAG: iron-containing alcohol dehydrogenase [Sphaerochaeta sp.]